MTPLRLKVEPVVLVVVAVMAVEEGRMSVVDEEELERLKEEPVMLVVVLVVEGRMSVVDGVVDGVVLEFTTMDGGAAT